MFNCEIIGVVRELVLWIVGNKVSSNSSIITPSIGREWKLSISGVLVDNGIPDGMEIASSASRWHSNTVTSTIACWVFIVNS